MKKTKVVKILLLSSIILLANLGHAEGVSNSSDNASKKKPFVPPGFEQLLEEQTTLVDVYYGGQFLTSVLASYTLTDLTFLEPQNIVSAIPGLLAPDEASNVLSQPMPTNSELVCLRKEDRNCGTMVTDAIEIIFDDGRFRADLFISKDLMGIQSAGIEKYLPPSDAGFSFLHGFAATGTGRTTGERNYSVSNTSILSFAENRLFTRGSNTSREGYKVDTLALQRDFRGLEYQLGYFRTPAANLVFIGQSDFRGASIASSLNTRMDLDQSTGSELQLFLESRSRVEIYKDDRLVSTAVYDTGNQQIDTRELPAGAYDIRLVIRDRFGRTREETRFYIKSNRLPPVGQTLFFIDAGELVTKVADRSLPEEINVSINRAGIARRLSKSFGAEAGLLSLDGESMVETGFFHLGRSHEIRLNLAESEAGDKGANLYSRIRIGKVVWTNNYRRTWLDPATIPGPVAMLGSELIQASSSISTPIRGGLLNITSRYNKRGQFTNENHGIKYNFPSMKFSRNSTFDGNIALSKDNNNFQILLTASLRFNAGRWQTEIAARATREEINDTSHTHFDPRLSAHWEDGDQFNSDLSFTLRAREERDVRSLETEFEASGKYGRGLIDARRSQDSEVTEYGINLFTNFLANSEYIGFGGSSLNDSALVIKTIGHDEDAYFDVLVNRNKRGSVEVGESAVISVSPFENYEVSLLARGNSLLDYNNQVKSATLYPGNVVTMKWEATRVVVVFGQLFNPDGTPLANALVKGVSGLAITDEFGMFQAEINSTATEFTAQTRQKSCRIDMPKIDFSEDIQALGEVLCR